MANSELMDMALKKIVDDLDDIEGSETMKHDLEDCPDPLNCSMHDMEAGEPLAKEGPGMAPGVVIEVKPGLPSMDGEKEEKNDGDLDDLSEEDAAELEKLLKK